MKTFAFALFALLILGLPYAYQIEQSREELLVKYYAYIDAKIPKSARMIVGDMKVNVYVGQSVVGIETKKGVLDSFEYAPLKNPNVVVMVSDDAAEKIEGRQLGLLDAIEGGEIKIKTYDWLSTFKVAAIKNAYSLSGIDKRLTDRSVKEEDIYSTNSLFMVRQRVLVWN